MPKPISNKPIHMPRHNLLMLIIFAPWYYGLFAWVEKASAAEYAHAYTI
jgi:hypothetical protein